MPCCNAPQQGRTGKEVLGYRGMSSFSNLPQTDTKTCLSKLLLGGRKTSGSNVSRHSASFIKTLGNSSEVKGGRELLTSKYVKIRYTSTSCAEKN